MEGIVTTQYLILENRQPWDAVLNTHEQTVNAIGYFTDLSTRVLEFDLDEAFGGRTSIRDVTEDIVREAYASGLADRDNPLVVHYLGDEIDDDFDDRHELIADYHAAVL